jgi:hypothetical protein
MRRLSIIGVLAATLVLVWPSLAGISSSGNAAVDQAIVLELGDEVRVAGEPIGCRVTRLAQYGNQVFLDCRRAGSLRGTYGTYLSGRDVLVVKFRSSETAKVVLRARHKGGTQRCG